MKMPDNWPTGAMCNAFTVEAGTEIHIGNFALGLKAALAAAPTPEVEPVLYLARKVLKAGTVQESILRDRDDLKSYSDCGFTLTPLYTHPAAPTPDKLYDFQVGDKVEKCTGDYHLLGHVMAVGVTKAGKVRYLVDHTIVVPGLLHVYQASNLRKIDEQT